MCEKIDASRRGEGLLGVIAPTLVAGVMVSWKSETKATIPISKAKQVKL